MTRGEKLIIIVGGYQSLAPLCCRYNTVCMYAAAPHYSINNNSNVCLAQATKSCHSLRMQLYQPKQYRTVP